MRGVHHAERDDYNTALQFRNARTRARVIRSTLPSETFIPHGDPSWRVVRFHRIGGPEVLQIDNIEVPAPASGEVRINVKALGLNRAEAMFRSGQYLGNPNCLPGWGTRRRGSSMRSGPGVTGFKPGDAVSTIPAFKQSQYGVYGDVAIAPAAAVAKHPLALSWSEAAAIWMQYMTAYGALIDIAQLSNGDAVLIPAASSSVGIAAIQIANLVGATPIALTRKEDKREALLRLGAAHVIVTENQDLVAEVQRHHKRQRSARRLRPGRRTDDRQTGRRSRSARHSF